MIGAKYQDQYLLQKQLNLQVLAQLQHQRNICEIMFSALSSAEKVALKLSQNKEYTSYDKFNSASFKNEIQLENELANKLVYLQSGLIAFKIQHGDFIFPDEKIKKEMINDIQKWSKYIKNRPKALESYKTLLELINGSTKEVSNNCFHQYDVKSNENSTLGWAEGMMFEKNNLENQNKEVQNDYEKTGTHKVPFKKERKSGKTKKDINYLYNNLTKDEQNIEYYLSTLINAIKYNQNLEQEPIKEKMSIYINNLKNSLEKIILDENLIQEKLKYYGQLMLEVDGNATKNKYCKLIYDYCNEIYSIYYSNLKNL